MKLEPKKCLAINLHIAIIRDISESKLEKWIKFPVRALYYMAGHILYLERENQQLRKQREELKKDGLRYYEQFRYGEKSKALAVKMGQIETKYPTEE